MKTIALILIAAAAALAQNPDPWAGYPPGYFLPGQPGANGQATPYGMYPPGSFLQSTQNGGPVAPPQRYEDNNGCPPGTHRYWASNNPIDPFAGCLTPGQAKMWGYSTAPFAAQNRTPVNRPPLRRIDYQDPGTWGRVSTPPPPALRRDDPALMLRGSYPQVSLPPRPPQQVPQMGLPQMPANGPGGWFGQMVNAYGRSIQQPTAFDQAMRNLVNITRGR